MMSEIDLELVLERLGIKVKNRSGNHIVAFCPDHYLYTGLPPSHAKWYIDINNGKTICFTEGRGSNLVYTVSRLRNCSCREAAAWILELDAEGDFSQFRLQRLSGKIFGMRRSLLDVKEDTIVELESIAEDVEKGVVCQTGYDFFMNPPGKLPTSINADTVQHFKVFERKWGYYSNRVIIPFIQKELLVGFCAIDTLGKVEWFDRHPHNEEGDYKKVLYPKGSKTGKCIFGYDDIKDGAEMVILTEGAREVMKLWQEGFKDSGAVLGSFISNDQIVLLSEKYPKRVGLMFDGDDAGHAAVERIGKKLVDVFDVYRIFTPRGFDPKNLGTNRLRETIEAAEKF